MALTIALGILFMLLPESAYGWAPGTHLHFAHEVLRFSYLLPETLRNLLIAYRPDFLYGCIAADITLGKAYVEYIYNCHNFDVGIDLLNHAKDDAQKAFVYGYISHLAADTVSHNYFVPYQNVKHFDHRTFRHAYWEVRLDQYFGAKVWRSIEEVIRNRRTHQHDLLLDTALRDTIFSFRTNKILFSSMLAIQRLKKWQAFVKGVNKKSPHRFDRDELQEYNYLAISGIIRLFNDWEESCVYRVDPTGAKTMEEAQLVRRNLRQLQKAGELTGKMHQEECRRFREHVTRKFFHEYPVQDKHFRPSIDHEDFVGEASSG